MKTNLQQQSELKKILDTNYHSIGKVIDIIPIPVSVNYVWKIEATSGAYILKQHLVLKDDELEYFHKNIVNLQKIGAPVPQIIKNDDGEFLTKFDSQFFDLSEFIESEEIDEANVSPEKIQDASSALAKLHKVVIPNQGLFEQKIYDYRQELEVVTQNIDLFKSNFQNIFEIADEKTKKQLNLLKDLIDMSKKIREELKLEFTDLDYVPTHGDPSAINILFGDDKTYFIDWDLFKLRPRIWDVQSGASLFSIKEDANAFIIEPRIDKMHMYLKNYDENFNLKPDEKDLLWEVISYNCSVYWLGYTLPAVLNHDFRLLKELRLNYTKELTYWFTKGRLEEYRKFIKNNL